MKNGGIFGKMKKAAQSMGRHLCAAFFVAVYSNHRFRETFQRFKGIIACISMIVLYIIFQKQLIEGIATSDGKL